MLERRHYDPVICVSGVFFHCVDQLPFGQLSFDQMSFDQKTRNQKKYPKMWKNIGECFYQMGYA
jgi:hypothetical protein